MFSSPATAYPGLSSVAAAGGAYGVAAQQQAQAEIQQMCLEVQNRMTQLQAAHARDFIAYSYTVCDNPQTLQQMHAQPFNAMTQLQAAHARDFIAYSYTVCD